MKASEFSTRVFAAHTRFWLILNVCLLLAAQAIAAQAPTVTIDGPSQVTAFSAVITGTVNPNGLDTIYHFQWGTTTAYDHVGGYMSVLTQNTPVAVSNQMTGLSPNTTYHYQLFATNNAGGASLSPDMTVTTLPPVPVVTANAPFDVTMTSVFIPCAVNPNGLPTQAYFQWGTTPAYGNTVRVGTDLTGNIPLGAGTSLTGLMPNTTYHYQVFATNTAGNGSSGDLAVTTLAGPPTPHHRGNFLH